MSNTIYVGNLKWEATEESLREFFSPIGEVSSVKIIMDRETGRSRGFAFVTMENSEQAVQELNGKELLGRPLKINVAADKPPQREFQPRESQPKYNDAPRESFFNGPEGVVFNNGPRNGSGRSRDWSQRKDGNYRHQKEYN